MVAVFNEIGQHAVCPVGNNSGQFCKASCAALTKHSHKLGKYRCVMLPGASTLSIYESGKPFGWGFHPGDFQYAGKHGANAMNQVL